MNISIRVPKVAFALVAVMAMAIGGVTVANALDDQGTGAPNPGSAPPSSRELRAALTGGQTETYTGIKPCRVFDTRQSSPMNNAARSFKVSGNLSSQGGAAACGIPTNATSIAINLTAISTGSTGFVRGWAFGGTPADATLLNFGTQINVSNQVNIPLCRDAGCSNAFTLRAFGSTDIVGDAVGYFTAPMYVALTDTGAVYGGVKSGVVSVAKTGTGAYTVKFDRNVRACSIQASSMTWASNVDVSPDAFAGGDPTVVTIKAANTSNTLVDQYMYVTATC